MKTLKDYQNLKNYTFEEFDNDAISLVSDPLLLELFV